MGETLAGRLAAGTKPPIVEPLVLHTLMPRLQLTRSQVKSRQDEAAEMAELKTKPTIASVTDFLNAVEEEERRRDCFAVVKIMQKATGAKPKMWGPSIVGFGDYRYTNARGQGTDWFLVGFSPRKGDLTLYVMPGSPRHAEHLNALGKHKAGKACVYIKRLADVDQDVLRTLVEESVAHLRARK